MNESKSSVRIEYIIVSLIIILIACISAACNEFKESSEGTVHNKPTVRVYVAGEVNLPDVYEIENDMRIIDAIKAAGGATENGDIESMDLAAFITDGQTIRVKPKEEKITETTESPEKPEEKPDKININTADTDELSKLSGIGEGLSERIIAYREKNGNFECIEDIQNVSGISEKRFEAICDYITV